eukprot:2179152-Pyramimonas_sp.AAC.2
MTVRQFQSEVPKVALTVKSTSWVRGLKTPDVTVCVYRGVTIVLYRVPRVETASRLHNEFPANTSHSGLNVKRAGTGAK